MKGLFSFQDGRMGAITPKNIFLSPYGISPGRKLRAGLITSTSLRTTQCSTTTKDVVWAFLGYSWISYKMFIIFIYRKLYFFGRNSNLHVRSPQLHVRCTNHYSIKIMIWLSKLYFHLLQILFIILFVVRRIYLLIWIILAAPHSATIYVLRPPPLYFE